MRTRIVRRSLACKGFTLLELLVVMSLLSMLMTGLISAMRTMAQTETKIDRRFEQLAELRTAYAFLSQTLGRQSNVKIDMPGATGKTMTPFAATVDSVTWVGILPARPNVGGRYYFHLAVERFDAGDALAMRLAPCDEKMTPPDWSTAERHLLISGVVKLVVQAQGSSPQGHEKENSWPKGWQSGWPIADVLPEQLRLSLQNGTQSDGQEWTFPLHASLQSDDTISTIAFGGGRR